MSFLKKLFGGGKSDGDASTTSKRQMEYKGYLIAATPYREGGQWQTCGIVSRTEGGETRQHRFVRADRFADEEAAADHAMLKGQQIIDQLGERMFG